MLKIKQVASQGLWMALALALISLPAPRVYAKTSVPKDPCAISRLACYDDYLAKNTCDALHTNTYCLLKDHFNLATSAQGGSRTMTVYRWAADTDPLVPHLLLGYNRLLVNAYFEAVQNRKERARAPGLLDAINSQFDYMVRNYSVIRNGALVWETGNNFAHAMVQAEYEAFFLNLSQAFMSVNNVESAKKYALLAFQLGQSFDLPAGSATGGVRSATVQCGPNANDLIPCWWYYSRAGVGKNDPGTALNQHIFAVYSLLSSYKLLRDYIPDSIIPPELGSKSQLLTLFSQRMMGGLYYMAFVRQALGNNPTHEPALDSFLNRQCSGKNCYYWSYYEFDTSTQQGHNIAFSSTCHYHTFVLVKSAYLFSALEADPLGQAARPAIDRLLNFKSPNGKRESVGLSPTTNPLYQFYLSETGTLAGKNIRKSFEGCPVGTTPPLGTYDPVAAAYLKKKFGL